MTGIITATHGYPRLMKCHEYFWVFILTVLCLLLILLFTESYSSSYVFSECPLLLIVELFTILNLRDYIILCLSCAVWPTLVGFIFVSE